MSLTSAQQEAVIARGNVLMVAGAGVQTPEGTAIPPLGWDHLSS